MFTMTDYLDVFCGVKELLDNNDACAYSYIEEKHPKLAGRIRALMERLMAQDPPFMKKAFDGWLQMNLGSPHRWLQIYQGKMTQPQKAMLREFGHAQEDLMAETLTPKDRLRCWVEMEEAAGQPLPESRKKWTRFGDCGPEMERRN
jgi:hypothetical protein